MEYSSKQISNFKLKLGYWFVTHKLLFKKILIGGLIALSLGLFGFSIFQATVILIIQKDSFNQMIDSLVGDLVDYQYFRQKNKPQDLQFLGLDSLAIGEGRYDLIAKIKNPNSIWLISNLTYQFISDNEVLAEKTTFVYPGEEKFLIAFNVLSPAIYNINLNFKEIKWQRVSDFSKFKSQRLNFVVLDKIIIPASQSLIRGKLPVTKVILKIKNESAYNFWEAGFYVVLYSGSKVIGVNYFNLEEFKAGQERQAEANWYYPLPAISRIEVIPEINILNPTIFMKFVGEPRPDEMPR